MAHQILYLTRRANDEVEGAAAFVGGEIVYGFPIATHGTIAPTDEAVAFLHTRPFPLHAVVLDRHQPLPQQVRRMVADLEGVPILAYRSGADRVGERSNEWEREWADTFADCGAECVEGQDALMVRLKHALPTRAATYQPLALPGRDWLWNGTFLCAAQDGNYSGGVGVVGDPFPRGGSEARLSGILQVAGDDPAVRRAVLRDVLQDPATTWHKSSSWTMRNNKNGIPMALTDEDIVAMLPEIEACIARGGLEIIRGKAAWGDRPDRLADLELTLGQALFARVAHAAPESIARWPDAIQEEMHNLRERWERAEEAIVGGWNRSWQPKPDYYSAEHDQPHRWLVTRHELECGATPRNCMVQRGLIEPWNGGSLPERLTDHDFARLSVSDPAVVAHALALTPGSVFVENGRRAVQRIIASWGDRAELASNELLPIMLNGVGRRKRLAITVLDGVFGRKSQRHRPTGSMWGAAPRAWWHVLTTLVPSDIGTKLERESWINRAMDRISAPDPETARMLLNDPGLADISRDLSYIIGVRMQNNGFFRPSDFTNERWLQEAREAERLRAAGSPVLASQSTVEHPRIGGRT